MQLLSRLGLGSLWTECDNGDPPCFQLSSGHCGFTDPCYRLVSERDATSKMRLRMKPRPAVALILQHLRCEARSFDAVGSAEEKRDLIGRQRKREWARESDGEIIDCSFKTELKWMQVKLTNWCGGERISSSITLQWYNSGEVYCSISLTKYWVRMLTGYLLMSGTDKYIKFKSSNNSWRHQLSLILSGHNFIVQSSQLPVVHSIEISPPSLQVPTWSLLFVLHYCLAFTYCLICTVWIMPASGIDLWGWIKIYLFF